MKPVDSIEQTLPPSPYRTPAATTTTRPTERRAAGLRVKTGVRAGNGITAADDWESRV